MGVYFVPASIGIVLVLLGRAMAVYLITAIFSRTELGVDWLTCHILFCGGLRIALAFPIFVQGLTLLLLLRRARQPASVDWLDRRDCRPGL